MAQPNEKPVTKASFDYIAERLEGGKDSYGLLMKEIVKTGICTACSACVAVCDVLDWDDNLHQPKLVGKCSGCGTCYQQCPRTITVPEDLIGTFKSAWIGRTALPEIQGKGQDGGTVTSLLVYLLDKGLIDGAVVTQHDENWNGKPIFVKNRDDIIKAAGSLYTHSQTVKALFDAIKEGNHALAFVGTPCNIDAIAKMESSPYGIMLYNLRNKIFKVGLFCMDSFAPETLYGFFKQQGVEVTTIKKMNITTGKLNLFNAAGEKIKSYKIKDLNKFKSTSCNYCVDLTSEHADVSVGSVGSPDGYNTILCRTPFGELVVKDAAAHGYIELKEATDKDLAAVITLAKMKKQSLYTVNVRTQYIFTPPVSGTGGIDMETRKAQETTTEARIPFLAKKLKLKDAKLVNRHKSIKFTLHNDSGYIMENLDIRISIAEDVFEKSAWHAEVAELYPYESMAFDYPLGDSGAETSPLVVIVDVKTGTNALLNEKISIQKLLDQEKEAAAASAAKK